MDVCDKCKICGGSQNSSGVLSKSGRSVRVDKCEYDWLCCDVCDGWFHVWCLKNVNVNVGDYTLSGQKYLNTVKYTCTNCVIYRLFNELCSKMRIDIYKYRKYVVLALTSMKFLHYLVFHEVLIY